MEPERWRRIEALYNGALTLSVPDRADYLDKACGADASLRHEVESLIRHAGESESLLRTVDGLKSAQQAVEADALPPGENWGDFRLIRQIGHGGFGRVYLAHDDALAREIALKVVRPRNAADLATALREGQMLARVQHRNVVSVFSARQVGEEVGLAMELIKGRHLADVVRQSGPMGADEAGAIGITLCQALGAVHGASLLHRDIKAHNVMRESGGRIVLMDFGASRDVRPGAQGRGDLTGTLLYMAPELFTRQSASRASDIYSLGVLLFYLVTGTYPVEAVTMADMAAAHVSGVRKRLSDCRPDLSNDFVRVVERAIAPRAADRWQGAGDFQAALTDASASMSGRFSTVSGEVATTIVNRVQRWAIIALCASAGVLAIGFITTSTYENALNIQGVADHSVWQWWGYGAMALIPLPIFSGLLLGFGWVVVTSWHLIQSIFGRGARAGRASLRARLSERLVPAGDLNNVGRLLVVGQFVGIAGTIWTFGDLLWAMVVQVDTARREIWSVLDESSFKLYLFHWTISVFLSGVILLWAALLRARRAGGRLDTAPIVVGTVMLLLTLLMATAPWKLFYHSTVPRVDIGDERCYQVAQRGETLTLFCPDADAQPSRNRTRLATDPELVRLANGRIFTSPAKAKIDREAQEAKAKAEAEAKAKDKK